MVRPPNHPALGANRACIHKPHRTIAKEKRSSWSPSLVCSLAPPWLTPAVKLSPQSNCLWLLPGRSLSTHLACQLSRLPSKRLTVQSPSLWEPIGLHLHRFPRTTQNKEVALFGHISIPSNYFLGLSTEQVAQRLL